MINTSKYILAAFFCCFGLQLSPVLGKENTDKRKIDPADSLLVQRYTKVTQAALSCSLNVVSPKTGK